MIFYQGHVFYTILYLTPRCAIPSLPNDTYEIQGPWHNVLVDTSVPYDVSEDRYEQCELNSLNTTQACDKWVYSTDPFETTGIAEVGTSSETHDMRAFYTRNEIKTFHDFVQCFPI